MKFTGCAILVGAIFRGQPVTSTKLCKTACRSIELPCSGEIVDEILVESRLTLWKIV